jgi:hypothetical protein
MLDTINYILELSSAGCTVEEIDRSLHHKKGARPARAARGRRATTGASWCASSCGPGARSTQPSPESRSMPPTTPTSSSNVRGARESRAAIVSASRGGQGARPGRARGGGLWERVAAPSYTTSSGWELTRRHTASTKEAASISVHNPTVEDEGKPAAGSC